MCQKPKHSRNIDSCLIPIIDKINSNPRLKTLLCCCGHNKYEKTIIVLDKEKNEVFEYFSGLKLPRYYKNGKIRKRFYVKDKQGFYHLDKSLIK